MLYVSKQNTAGVNTYRAVNNTYRLSAKIWKHFGFKIFFDVSATAKTTYNKIRESPIQFIKSFAQRQMLVRQLTRPILKPLLTRSMSDPTAATPSQRNYWLLQYTYVEGVLEKRVPYRSAHLGFIKKYVESGSIILGGAFANPPDGAAIIFKDVSRDIVEEFAKNDPYVLNGIVTGSNIREWTVVVGTAYDGSQ